ncbi:hypothetical protein GEMRC1_013937 [Eukaryota sp. GEM-RC1]
MNCFGCNKPYNVPGPAILLLCDFGHAACSKCASFIEVCPICANCSTLEETPNSGFTTVDQAASGVDVDPFPQIPSHQIDSVEADSTKSSADVATPPLSLPHPSQCIHLPHALLVAIQLHLLRPINSPALKINHDEPRRPLRHLKQHLPTFFKKYGYVIKAFFETTLLPVTVKDLHKLSTLSSHFGTFCQFVFLHISDNPLVDEFLFCSHVIAGVHVTLRTHNDLEFLMESTSYFPCLQQLHVTVYSAGQVRLLVDLLKVGRFLTTIIGRYIGDDGASALAKALKHNTSVRRIDLSGCNIFDEGAIALADALKFNSMVTFVELSLNYIEVEGANALAKALQVNNTITSINLDNNDIGCSGAISLSKALEVNTSLTSIYLCSNDIECDGVTELANALLFNSTLRTIDLRGKPC